MTRFAPVEATMEQRAQEQQLELLMLTAGEVTPPELFDSTTRTEIVNLLKPCWRSPQPGRDAGGDGR